ncbi:hypothetical protein C9418_12735 [Rhizobium sp. SEMIA 4032]|nr:hypothetical protein C9418_12735 [Rhizobium sp. SEMIA 4032]
MSLAYFAQNARSAERMRERIRRSGMVAGKSLWTDAEREIIRTLAPDYNSIAKLLPNRTRKAIRQQASQLGSARNMHIWTGAELAKLRKLYPSAESAQICAVFPHSPWENIKKVARYHGFRRARKPYKPIGNPPIDGLLLKCVEANLRYEDLDKICRSKTYFKGSSWRYQKPNYNRFLKAIEYLEGRISVSWPKE